MHKAFYSRILTGVHGPTYIFWANLRNLSPPQRYSLVNCYLSVKRLTATQSRDVRDPDDAPGGDARGAPTWRTDRQLFALLLLCYVCYSLLPQ